MTDNMTNLSAITKIVKEKLLAQRKNTSEARNERRFCAPVKKTDFFLDAPSFPLLPLQEFPTHTIRNSRARTNAAGATEIISTYAAWFDRLTIERVMMLAFHRPLALSLSKGEFFCVSPDHFTS